jgi:glycosyltransferase involved in cell wall biosynthesis
VRDTSGAPAGGRRRNKAALPGRLERIANSPWAPVARLMWTAVIGCELAAERVADGIVGCADPAADDVSTRLTMVVKTFERPKVLERLLSSVRRVYPRLKVVVVDDSATPCVVEDPFVEVVAMPFNVGLSAGRNEGLRRVATPFVMVTDDDFVFHRGTRLSESLALMDGEPEIDIMGGRLLDLPGYSTHDLSRARLYTMEGRALAERGTSVGGLPVYDAVANFFIARTERLRLVPWDDRLRLMEHTDFFTSARGVLLTVYNEGLTCLHARTPFDGDYMAYRRDFGDAGAVINAKWGSAPARVTRSPGAWATAPPRRD